ncbi:MAG: GNAT family N-acetyltransferase [Gammaproteobacteria bacterium]|nr:GNAT family N-acetyltransferase [Gammaproteobacteria bacterium]
MSALAQRVFERHDPESMNWRLTRMPDVTVFVATDWRATGRLKAGYAATENRYYSWLGGVDPDYRGRGIAGELMAQQHAWLKQTDFKLVETHVAQANDAMVALNLKHGLRITGMFLKRGEPNYIMQKDL